MTISITEAGGTVTVAGEIVSKNDLKVAGNVSITGALAVSGNLHVEDGVTESDATPVRNRFGLVVPVVPLGAATKGYTVAPCALNIVAIHAAIVAYGDTNVVLSFNVNGGAADPETLTIGTGSIGTVYSLTLDTPTAVTTGQSIGAYTDGAALSGSVNVTFICEAT